MSEPELADALSVSRPTLNRWINGKNLPHMAIRESVLSALAVPFPSLPPTAPDIIDKLTIAQNRLMAEAEEAPILTEHVLHAGMYSRTITMQPNTVLVGALIKVPTIVITVGHAKVLVGKEWADVDGYRVLPAQAGRKQLFVSIGALIITMIFPTSAKTVSEAEAEFTDECELLLSRRHPDLNTVINTGEQV